MAWLHDTSTKSRLGVEYVRVSGDRPGATLAGFDARTGGSTITLELRYQF